MPASSSPALLPLLQVAEPYICDISPYLPGKPISALAREMALEESSIIKLASNENPLGMSPKARAAVEAALGEAFRYPDPHDLVAALAARLQVDPARLVLGNGSNDVLDLAARVFLGAGRSAVMSQHAFAVYPLASQSTGAQCLVVSATAELGHDLNAMRQAVRSDTRLIWVANPNNPTGGVLGAEALLDFLRQVPADVAVVLDEAYNEYLPPEQRYDSVAWQDQFPNLIVTRTFSKIYGLAGLRVGYAVAHPRIADLLHRARQPFNVNNLALAAARAALDDHDFVAQSQANNRQGLQQLQAGLAALGVSFLPSSGNFLCLRVGAHAAEVHQRLLRQGVIVRPVANYGLPQWLRVTVGTPAENTRFLAALGQALAA